MRVLEARGVCKTYRRGGFFSKAEAIPVLRGVDLDIAPGECVGLVGRSGAGKSTLGRIILGLESPDAGTVRLFGQPVQDKAGRLRMPNALRRQVQVVFQDALGSVNPRLTAGQIIAEPLCNFERLRGKALRERIAGLLECVDLVPSDADKHPNRFSGGQLQRVCIARALAARPGLIVLDEAVSSLDMLVQARILDLLEALRRKEGTAYLFVTHDLRLVRRFCDRAFAVQDGRLEPFDHRQLNVARLPESLRHLVSAMLPSMPPRPGEDQQLGRQAQNET